MIPASTVKTFHVRPSVRGDLSLTNSVIPPDVKADRLVSVSTSTTRHPVLCQNTVMQVLVRRQRLGCCCPPRAWLPPEDVFLFFFYATCRDELNAGDDDQTQEQECSDANLPLIMSKSLLHYSLQITSRQRSSVIAAISSSCM